MIHSCKQSVRLSQEDHMEKFDTMIKRQHLIGFPYSLLDFSGLVKSVSPNQIF